MIISYCLNPSCPNPKNHSQLKFRHICGWSLIIYARYRAMEKIGKGDFGNTFIGYLSNTQNNYNDFKLLLKPFLSTTKK